MARVLVICPQERDLHAARSSSVHVRFAGPDLDAGHVDTRALLDELAELPADGVVGTKDRSALLAAQLAERRGLPGPSPGAIVSCQHKPTSRAIQQRVAQEATPRFAQLDGPPPFPPPWWVKPVVGRLSQEARRVDSEAELAQLAEDPELPRRVRRRRRSARGRRPWLPRRGARDGRRGHARRLRARRRK